MLNFWIFLPPEEPLVDPFNETRALSSRKYVSKPGISIPNLSKKLQFFWLQFTVFATEKQSKDLNVYSFFIYKIILGDYFQ